MDRCTGLRTRQRATLRLLAAVFSLTVFGCTTGEEGALPSGASDVAVIYAGECDAGVAGSCYALALLYSLGEDAGHGVPANAERAEALRAQACEGGHELACRDEALLPPRPVAGAEPAELEPPSAEQTGDAPSNEASAPAPSNEASAPAPSNEASAPVPSNEASAE